MRVLFVSKYIDHILYFFLRGLSAFNSVTVVFENENEWSNKLLKSPIRSVRLVPRSRFDRSFQDQIERIWRNDRFDVVQSFHGNAQLANLLHWNSRNVPIVGYRAYVGHLSFVQNPSAYWSVRSPRLSATVAVSHAVKSYLESFRLLQPRNVVVVPHGVNQQWIDSQLNNSFDIRSRLGLHDDAFVVISVASLRPYKHFELVVRAAEELRSCPIHFVHLGRPNGWDRRVSEKENIHFLGHQDSPIPIMADADVVISTSHNEAFGRSNLEAMALGKPLIGSNTGGLLDLIDNGTTGKLFESLNAQSLARQVLAYYEDQSLLQLHGENARIRVSNMFLSSHMAEKYNRVYASVLEQRPCAD